MSGAPEGNDHRATQPDPIGLAGGLNLYGYADGDQINFSDPFGLYAERQDEGASSDPECRAGYVWVKDIGECVNPDSGEGYDPVKEAQAERQKQELARIDEACRDARYQAAAAVGTDGAFVISGGGAGLVRVGGFIMWGAAANASPGGPGRFLPGYNATSQFNTAMRVCKGLTS